MNRSLPSGEEAKETSKVPPGLLKRPRNDEKLGKAAADGESEGHGVGLEMYAGAR